MSLIKLRPTKLSPRRSLISAASTCWSIMPATASSTAQEEATEEEIQRQIDTNVYGVIHVTRAVLPHMRTQRSGHIINMSSIAGLVGTAGLGYYNLTKFALEGMSEALAQEVSPLGIHVTAIEPGPFRAGFCRPIRTIFA